MNKWYQLNFNVATLKYNKSITFVLLIDHRYRKGNPIGLPFVKQSLSLRGVWRIETKEDGIRRSNLFTPGYELIRGDHFVGDTPPLYSKPWLLAMTSSKRP